MKEQIADAESPCQALLHVYPQRALLESIYPQPRSGRRNAMVTRLSFPLFIMVAVLSALLVSCIPATQPDPASSSEATTPADDSAMVGGQITWARSGYPDTLDPHKYSHIEGAIAILNLLDPLVWRNPADNQYYPGLAREWEYADDLRSLTLYLREDVSFHDGTPFNADAVAFMLDRIKDPNTNAAAVASFMGSYANYDVLDVYTIRINFSDPNPLFIEWLTHPSLAPISPAAVKQYGDMFGDNLVGTGPFRLLKWDRQAQEVIMERNPDYDWGPSFFEHDGAAYVDKLVVKGILDPAARLAALEAGEVNIINGVPELDVKRLESDPNYTVWAVPSAGIIHSLAFNTEKAPLDDIQVRRALITSVDLAGLQSAVYRNLHNVPVGPFRRGLACWDGSVAEVWPYDVEKANQLLDAAGWVTGSDGIREKDGQKLTVTTFWPDADDPAPVVYIQSEWKKIGVDLQIQTLDFNSVIAESQKGNHMMTWGSTAGSDPDVARTVFGSGQARNFTRVADAELDALLAAGTATPDLTERCNAYKQVQRRVMELALIIPYLDANNISVSRSDITGLTFRGDGVMPYNFNLRRIP